MKHRKENHVWLNGTFEKSSRARIPVFDRGFLYGDGIFESIRSEQGHILYLEDHLSRLRSSAESLRLSLNPDWDIREILQQLMEKNGLQSCAGRIKVLVTRGEVPLSGLLEKSASTLCIMAETYHPPGEDMYARGWVLRSVTEGFTPPLAAHKTLNYLYYLLSKQLAADAGGDEPVLLDKDKNVAETAMGSLLIHDGEEWIVPESPYQLRGITVEKVAALLREDGQGVKHHPLALEDLRRAESVWVLNSLIGIMPARELDGTAFPRLRVVRAGALRQRLFAKE